METDEVKKELEKVFESFQGDHIVQKWDYEGVDVFRVVKVAGYPLVMRLVGFPKLQRVPIFDYHFHLHILEELKSSKTIGGFQHGWGGIPLSSEGLVFRSRFALAEDDIWVADIRAEYNLLDPNFEHIIGMYNGILTRVRMSLNHLLHEIKVHNLAGAPSQ